MVIPKSVIVKKMRGAKEKLIPARNLIEQIIELFKKDIEELKKYGFP